MDTCLSQFIDYATGGNRAEFARIVGWSPQYLNTMLKGERIGLNPVVTLLVKWNSLLSAQIAEREARCAAAYAR